MAEVAPRDNPPVPQHPGRIEPHPRFIHPSISPQLRQPGGTKIELSRVDTAPHGVEPQSHGPIADCLGRVERGQLGEDWYPAPVQTSCHIFATPTPRGQKSSSPGSTPPRAVSKPQSRRPIADWLERVVPAPPGENRTPCPDHKTLRISNQGARRARRGYIAPEEDWAPSPVQTCFYISTTPTPRRRKSGYLGSTPSRTVWKPQSYGPIADWLERAKRGQPGEDRPPYPVQTSFYISITPTPHGRKSSSPRSTLLRTVWKPQSHGPIADWLEHVEQIRHGEDTAPSPVQTSFHISTTPVPRERKSSSPGSTPPRAVWKP